MRRKRWDIGLAGEADEVFAALGRRQERADREVGVVRLREGLNTRVVLA